MAKKDRPIENELEQSEKSWKRRSILKTIGAASSMTIGFGTTNAVTAAQPEEINKTQRTATESEIKRAIQAEKMQRLLNELGNPSIRKQKAEKITVGKDEEKYSAIMFSTPLGEIMYGTSHDGMSMAQLTIGGKLLDKRTTPSTELIKQLPSKYHSLPASNGIRIAIANTSDPILIRHSTEREKQRLSEITGIPEDQLMASINSASSEFKVINKDKTDKKPVKVSIPSNRASFREVTNQEFRDSTIQSSDVTTQGVSCWGACLICAQSTVHCAECAFICVTSASPPMVVPCAICLYLNCYASTASCQDCYNCQT